MQCCSLPALEKMYQSIISSFVTRDAYVEKQSSSEWEYIRNGSVLCSGLGEKHFLSRKTIYTVGVVVHIKKMVQSFAL